MPRTTFAGGRNTKNRYSLGISSEVLAATTPFESDELVIEKSEHNFFVASKINQHRRFEPGFTPLYYRYALVDGEWMCSSTDPRTVGYCKTMVEAYRLRKGEAA